MNKLIVVLSILLICFNSMSGQSSPGSFVFSATIHDSLSAPVRIAFDNTDNIYVTDPFRKKINKYDAAGNFTGSILTIGSPISIAINGSDQIFFGDGETGKIYMLHTNGTATELYAGASFPSSMVFGSDGLLYITDSKLHRVIVLDSSGKLIRTIGAGTLTYPTGIAFDKKNGRILVAEHGGIGSGFNPVVNVRIFGLAGNLITSFGSHGNGDGKFYRIQGIAVGRCGEIYVPEPYQGNVSVFSENAIFQTRFGQYGDSTSQLRVPLDIAVNSRDRIFITAENNGTIEVFDIDYILPTANITCGNKSICTGATTDIPVHFTGTPPWTFTYTVNGTNPVTVSNTIDNPYILTVSAPGNYSVTALSDSSHAGTCFSGNAVITVNSVIPASTITAGNLLCCPGQTADIPILFTGLAPWTFTYTHNGANPKTISNVGQSPYLLNVSESGNYEIIALSGAGCAGSSFTGNATVTTNLAPTAIFESGNTVICDGDSTDLVIGLTGNPPWSLTYTVSSTNPVTINDITVNPCRIPVSHAGIYRIVQVQDAFCVNAVSSGEVEITVKALPTATITSGNASMCHGDATNIVVDLTGVSPWTFTYTMDGLYPETVSGVAVSPYVFPVSHAGACQLTALSDAGCTGTSFSGAAIISENPLPVVSLGPPAELCEGDSLVIAPDSPFVFYIWSDSTTGPNLPVYTAGTYSVTVTDYNGCTGSASKTITSRPLPTSSITSGNATICAGETTDLTIGFTGTPPWAFTYTVNGTNPQTVANITTSPCLLNVYQPGTYRIIETADAHCRNSASAGSAVITVNPLPTYNFSSGNAAFCAGQSTNLVIDFTGTAPWTFTYTVNGTNPVTISGIIANPFVMPVSLGGAYEIIALSDAFCYGPGHDGTATITENPLPAVNLGPDVTINAGETLTLDAGPSLAGYLWSDGSTSETLEATAAGTYGVTVTDYNGCMNSGAMNVAVVVPTNRDLLDINITGPTCFSATQTITVAGGGATFVVQQGGTATLIAGMSIRYLPGARVDSGGYMHGYITPDNIYCGGISPPSEATPFRICQTTGNHLVSPAAPDGGCSDSITSGPISVAAATAGGSDLENVLKVFPNPSTGLVTIEISNRGKMDLRLEMHDMAGRTIYSRAINAAHYIEKVDLGNFPGGLYMVRLSSGNIFKITKLVLID